MNAADKAKDKVQAAKGKVKKAAGQALDDPYMEGEGSDLVHQARDRW